MPDAIIQDWLRCGGYAQKWVNKDLIDYVNKDKGSIINVENKRSQNKLPYPRVFIYMRSRWGI